MLKPLISFDWAVKRLLRNKANFGILEGFLSELLRQDIKIDRILESEGNQEHESDKFNRVDILAEDSKNQLVIIELQNNRELDYFHTCTMVPPASPGCTPMKSSCSATGSSKYSYGRQPGNSFPSIT